MNPISDKPAFAAMLNTACKSIGKPIFDSDVLELNFSLLSEFTIEQVQAGLYKALDRPDIDFGITVTKIKAEMGVKKHRELEWQDIIRHARKIECPMGVLARMFIKSHELNNNPDHHLKGAAMAFLDKLPELQAKADRGEYTEHELCRMYAHNIKVSQTPFMPGYCVPSNLELIGETWGRAKLTHEFASIKNDKDALLLESRPINDEMIAESKAKISEALSMISMDEPKRSSADIHADQVDKLNNLVEGIE